MDNCILLYSLVNQLTKAEEERLSILSAGGIETEADKAELELLIKKATVNLTAASMIPIPLTIDGVTRVSAITSDMRVSYQKIGDVVLTKPQDNVTTVTIQATFDALPALSALVVYFAEKAFSTIYTAPRVMFISASEVISDGRIVGISRRKTDETNTEEYSISIVKTPSITSEDGTEAGRVQEQKPPIKLESQLGSNPNIHLEFVN